MPVIGFLAGPTAKGRESLIAAFQKGLTEVGYSEGRNIVIESRWAEGQFDRLPAMANELVQRKVAVIVAFTTPAGLAAKAATSTIPTVLLTGDPVGTGLVASLSRPGSNITGLSYMIPETLTREQVYAFAWGCIERGQPEAAAAAVICFEWLQRPENVLAGYLRWTDYRSKEWPNAVKIEHHKTGAVVWHPLEEQTEAGIVRFYEDAEAVLSRLPRRGVPMILREVKQGITKPFSFSGMQKIVHTMRDKIGLPSTFTLDACRHGGMTELEEAQLTDGQGRALSAHKSQQAYEGYAKRTMERALSATRKRYAHRLANAAGTNIQNEPRNDIQNADVAKNKISAK
jgi:hypothetical protein